MPIPQDFDYIKPASLDEALKVLSQYGKKTKILAGGTDLSNMLKQGFPVPELMVDIKGLKELDCITRDGNTLFIGSLVTFSSIIKSAVIRDKFTILWDAAHLVASNGVRNRATMVGNICSAVACMDSAAPLLVHDAVVHLKSARAERQLPVNQWFVDNRKTAIKDDELVTGVSIELPVQKYAGAYQKLMRYSGEDLSQANVGVLALADGTFRVAFGSVGPIPKRSPKIEHFLNGKDITDVVLDDAKDIIETVMAPMTDVRATKEYRMHMTKVMFGRAMKEAMVRLSKL